MHVTILFLCLEISVLVHFHCWCSCAEFLFIWNRSLLHFIYYIFAPLGFRSLHMILLKFFLLTFPQWRNFQFCQELDKLGSQSEVFLVLSYTHISISSLGWLSLSGSWSLPALQVPSVTRTTPTYWARLHSPVNYQTGVSFCPSPANPFSAPLSYWAVVCPET